MATRTIAPWADEELASLPEDGYQYELVEGRLVRMVPPGGEHGGLSLDLGSEIHVFVKRHHLGRVLAAETGFLLSASGQSNTVLAPDAAFVRLNRLPARESAEWRGYWRVAPDLVVEVASPSQSRPMLSAKAREWLAYGVRLIWVVWPAEQQVDVWRASADPAPVTLGLSDVLDGEDVVPGFLYPVEALFS